MHAQDLLIDAHAHLDMYGDDLHAALREITEGQILTISTSMDLESYRRNLEIAEHCRLVLPTFGVHPWKARQYVDRLGDLVGAIDASPMLGEIGLDYRWVEDPAQYPAQRRVFQHFLEAARDQDKIVNLHTAGAEEDVLQMLDRSDIRRAIVHWYSGPINILREMIDREYYFTVGVEVLSSTQIKRIALEIPSHLLLTETDNPGGAEWLTGQVGMPSMVREVVQALAELRGSTSEGIAQIVQTNFERLLEVDIRA